MKFTITNQSEELWPKKVRITLDVDLEIANEVVNAARKIHDDNEKKKMDEMLAALTWERNPVSLRYLY